MASSRSDRIPDPEARRHSRLRPARHIQRTSPTGLQIEVYCPDNSSPLGEAVAYLAIPGFGSRYVTTGPRRLCQLAVLQGRKAPGGVMEGVDWGHDASGLYAPGGTPREAMEGLLERLLGTPDWHPSNRAALYSWAGALREAARPMNRAHKALSDDDRHLCYTWPMGGTGDIIPWASDETLRHYDHRIGPRHSRLIVVAQGDPEAVMAEAKEVFRPWLPPFQSSPAPWTRTPTSRSRFGYDVPTTSDTPGVWAGLMLPMEGTYSPAVHAGNFLTRIPLPVRAGFWAHPDVSVGILWGEGTGHDTRGGVDLIEQLLDLKDKLIFGKYPGMNEAKDRLMADNLALERNPLGMARYLASRMLHGPHVPSMRAYERRSSTNMAYDLRQLIVGVRDRTPKVLVRGAEAERQACRDILRRYERAAM